MNWTMPLPMSPSASFGSGRNTLEHLDYEKELSIASCSDLQLSPIHMERDEEKLSEQEAASSPLPCVASPPQKSFYRCYEWMCDKTFPSEENLRVHIHEYHSTSSLNVG